MPMLQASEGALWWESVDLTPPWIEDPPTILFHHGIGITSGIWSEWLGLLAGRFRLIRFDLRGYGKSSSPPEEYAWSVERFADDALAVADAAGARRFHFVGESLGGIIAYHLAIYAPERLSTMTAVSASHRGAAIGGGIDRWRELVADRGFEAWCDMMMECRFAAGSLDPAAWSWFDRTQRASSARTTIAISTMLRQHELASRMPEISVPTLLLGGQSPFVPPPILKEVQSLIPGAELVVMEGAKHGVVFSHAEQCCAAVTDFIRRH